MDSQFAFILIMLAIIVYIMQFVECNLGLFGVGLYGGGQFGMNGVILRTTMFFIAYDMCVLEIKVRVNIIEMENKRLVSVDRLVRSVAITLKLMLQN